MSRSSFRQVASRAVVLLAAALAGCSSLPAITPDLVRVDPNGVKFQAANGRILSPAKSRDIIAGLAGSGGDTDVLARHLALEQAISETPLSLGNRVTLLEDGPDTYAAMLGAIASARDTINMESYIFEADEAGQRFADALLAKQAAGVQVNLIHDGVGTLSTPAAFFRRLRDGGVNVLEFNPVNPLKAKAGWDVNERDHRKLLVVDGQRAILGGINISGVYSSRGSAGSPGLSGGSRGNATATAGDKKSLPWRDTDLLVEGPAVVQFQRLFIETWESQNGAPLAPRDYLPSLAPKGDDVVRAIGSRPDDPVSQIYVTLISALNSAESEILLTNAYFVPDPQLKKAMTDAVGRGVDVKLIVPSTTDSALVFHAGRAHYEPLLRGGVKIYERRAALLHAKTAVIDGVWSTVGSTNLDWRSFLHNQELTAVVLGAEFGAKMKASFERDLAESDQITLDAWQRRPVGVRMKELFARLWEYWL